MTTESECIEALRAAADELGESPTKADYEALGLTPASGTIQRVCGSWNAAKALAGLETNPSRGSRVQSKPDDVSLPDGTEWANLSQDQRWHYRNREWNTERSLRRRTEHRQWLHEYKAQSDGCERCGETDPAYLDFHHCEEEDKEMAINEMVNYGYSKESIRTEIERCQLLCANCHTKAHHGSGAKRLLETETHPTKEERLRAWSYEYKRDRGCLRCGEQDPVCLQFHHVGNKNRGIGAMIADSYPEERIKREVENCNVLCANCHREEHATSWSDE